MSVYELEDGKTPHMRNLRQPPQDVRRASNRWWLSHGLAWLRATLAPYRLIEWDCGGYPTEHSLRRLRNVGRQWLRGRLSWPQALRYVVAALLENHYGDRAVGIVQCRINGKRLTLLAYHTVGWSGNEDIIAALMEGKAGALFRSWLLARADRGGHYYFDVVRYAPFLTEHTNDVSKTRPVARR